MYIFYILIIIQNFDLYNLQLEKLLKATYRSGFQRALSKNVSVRPPTYQKRRWSTF